MRRKQFQEQTITITKILLFAGLFGVVFVLGIHVLLLIFASILGAIFLSTLGDFVSRFTGFGRYSSLFLVIFSVLLFFGIGSYFFFPNLARQLDSLREALPESIEDFQGYIQQNEWSSGLLENFDFDMETLFTERVLTQLTDAATLTFFAFGAFIIVIFVSLYLAVDPSTYVSGLIRLFPIKSRPRVAEIITETGETLKWWLLGRLISMTSVGVISFIGLSILGVPMALSLSFINAMLTFIPNIGPVLATIPAALIGFTVSPQTSLSIVILYFLAQSLENYLITPIVQRRTVDLPPALALSLQVIGGVLFGFLGLTLATPIAAAGMVIVQKFYIEDTLGDRSSAKI